MKRLSMFVFSVCVLLFAVNVSAKDIITVTISNIDKNISGRIDPVESIKGKGLHKVYAYIKIISDSTKVEPKLFFLEWRLIKNDSEIVLFNYNNDSKWMKYDRRLDVINDYYRVHKTIFGSKPGVYEFRVYNKDDNGKYFVVKKSSIILEGDEL
jgi:GTP-dependent phosphoenolpyruvate carboxykinase